MIHLLAVFAALFAQIAAASSPVVPTVVLTIPIPAGCMATITGSNVVITCMPVVTTPPPPPGLQITTPINLPGGRVGTPYSVDISKLALPTGGVAPYTYSAGANFPTWLTLSPNGILSGLPIITGTFSISFIVTDSSKTTSSDTIPAKFVIAQARSMGIPISQ